MNELFNIIKSSLRANSFYIPSQNAFVNGCSLTIKQYNDLLELDATVDYGFEQYIKFSIITDTIIKENLDSIDNLLYFDKPFLLAQIKMAQEENFLGLSLKEYQTTLKERISNYNFASYVSEYNNNNLFIGFCLNKLSDVQQINKDFFENINNNYKVPGDIVTLEIFKYLKEIKYLNQSIGDVRDVKLLKPLLNELPANLVEKFNELLQKVNTDIKDLNTFEIKEEKFVFNPTLEFMLS
jgi:hypothetical protein